MSVLVDHPNHFREWIPTRTEYFDAPEAVLREMFIPRRVYGDNLRGLLHWHAGPARERSGTSIEFFDKEAVDVLASEGAETTQLPTAFVGGGQSAAGDRQSTAGGHRARRCSPRVPGLHRCATERFGKPLA